MVTHCPCTVRRTPGLTAIVMQVWLAKCIPLNKMVAIKLMDLENFGANLVSTAVSQQDLLISGPAQHIPHAKLIPLICLLRQSMHRFAAQFWTTAASTMVNASKT